MSTAGREDAHPRISLDALSDWNAIALSCKGSTQQIIEAQAKEDGLSKEERELLLKHMDKVGRPPARLSLMLTETSFSTKHSRMSNPTYA